MNYLTGTTGMIMTYQQQLENLGITVKSCNRHDHGASGFVEMSAPTVINNCLSPDRPGYQRVLRHEAIHIAQLRLGIGKVNALLKECEADFDPNKWDVGHPYEEPASGYENSECAKEVILQALSEPLLPPPITLNKPFLGPLEFLGVSVVMTVTIAAVMLAINK